MPNPFSFCSIEVLSKNVRHVSVPYYSTLSIKKISEFVAATDQDMHMYMPDN